MKPENQFAKFWSSYDWAEYDLFRRGWQVPEDPPEREELCRRVAVPVKVPPRDREPIHVRARRALEDAKRHLG
ncbi:MAG: hypothetical protein GY822_19750 [Deltaproteobacteria bacterium]|nr:hypothetical protein [Deltaproteobacteria bacterium]